MNGAKSDATELQPICGASGFRLSMVAAPFTDAFRKMSPAMTFAIHASKDGQIVVTIRISPDAAVDKARLLESSGWQVHITDTAGHHFGPSDFDRFLDRSGTRGGGRSRGETRSQSRKSIWSKARCGSLRNNTGP
jgi:hypothetical protein